jgi:hypothetical protein
VPLVEGAIETQREKERVRGRVDGLLDEQTRRGGECRARVVCLCRREGVEWFESSGDEREASVDELLRDGGAASQ